MDGGMAGGRRLLSPVAVRARAGAEPAGSELSGERRRASLLRPAVDGLREERRRSVREMVLFGHDGSDGTYAWAWPDAEPDGAVLHPVTRHAGRAFRWRVSSRQPSSITISTHLQLTPRAAGRRQSSQSRFGNLLGRDQRRRLLRHHTPGRRADARPTGRGAVGIQDGDDHGRFVHEANPQVWIEFVRGEDGSVAAMRTHFGGAGGARPSSCAGD